MRTFRDNDGLWEGHSVQDVATPEAWTRDPATVWRFYQLRRAQLKEAQPNAAHKAIAQAESSPHFSLQLITQNVDNLHQRAGSKAIAMHGELIKLRCEGCDEISIDHDNCEPQNYVPCSHCGHPRLRPHIVWFGEMPLRLDHIDSHIKRCTHFAAIGTSGVVYPAAGLLAQARSQGAKTWVNSLDAPDNLDPADRFLPGPATLVAEQIFEEITADILDS